jgi:hypothetical protein
MEETFDSSNLLEAFYVDKNGNKDLGRKKFLQKIMVGKNTVSRL